MAPLPLRQPQDSEPQAPLKQLQPQEFDPVDPPQEFDPVNPSQESDPVYPTEDSESPRPRLVVLDTASKLAHKLLETWYKEAGKVANEKDDEATAADHSRPPRLGLGGEMSKELGDEDGFESFDPFYGRNLSSRMAGFNPCDLSQYAGRFVAATRPTEPETFNVTDNYVIVKTYRSDDEEDNDTDEKDEEANDAEEDNYDADEKDEEANDTEKDNDAEEDNDTEEDNDSDKEYNDAHDQRD